MSKGIKLMLYVLLAVIVAVVTAVGALAMEKQAKNDIPLEVNFESNSSVTHDMDALHEGSSEGTSVESDASSTLSQGEILSDEEKATEEEQGKQEESSDVLPMEESSMSGSSEVVEFTERAWADDWVKPLSSIVFVDSKGESLSSAELSTEETVEETEVAEEETVEEVTEVLSSAEESEEETEEITETADETAPMSDDADEETAEVLFEASTTVQEDAASDETEAVETESSAEWEIEVDGISYLTLDFIRSYLSKNTSSSSISVYLEDMRTGKVYTYGTEEEHYVASTIHPAIAMTVYHLIEQGEMSLDNQVEYLEEKDYEDGEGLLISSIADGESRTVSELLELMISESDNIATNMIIRKVCDVAGYDWYKKELSAILGVPYTGRRYDAVTMAHTIRYFCMNYGKNPHYAKLKEYLESTSEQAGVTAALPAGSFFQKQGSFVMDQTSSLGSIGAIYGEYPLIFAVYSDDEDRVSGEVLEELGKYFYFVAQTGIFPEKNKVLEE